MKPKIRGRISWAAALTATAGLAATVGVLPGTAAAAPRPASVAQTTAAPKPAEPVVPVLTGNRATTASTAPSRGCRWAIRDPRGAQISIAVISSRATGPGPSVGWLFFNGGGPNPQVSTMSRVYPNLPAQWRER